MKDGIIHGLIVCKTHADHKTIKTSEVDSSTFPWVQANAQLNTKNGFVHVQKEISNICATYCVTYRSFNMKYSYSCKGMWNDEHLYSGNH